MGGFEHIEHTADVGIRAWDQSLEGCFREATLGVLDILDAWRPGRTGETVNIAVEARDLGGVLVDWLSEVLYVHDSRDAVVTEVTVTSVGDRVARGTVTLAERGDDVLEGTAVKAVTYHGLKVEESADGWGAEVILDV